MALKRGLGGGTHIAVLGAGMLALLPLRVAVPVEELTTGVIEDFHHRINKH